MRLFLYGTLVAASGTPMAGWLAPRLHRPRRAWVRGRLIAIPTRDGWFPALLPGHGRVWGQVCEASLGPAAIARLDRYEGSEYRPLTTPAHTRANPLRPARLYRWRTTPPPGARPIADGDFLAWLARSGGKAFIGRGS